VLAAMNWACCMMEQRPRPTPSGKGAAVACDAVSASHGPDERGVSVTAVAAFGARQARRGLGTVSVWLRLLSDHRSPDAAGNGTFTGIGCSARMYHASTIVRFPAERTARPAGGGASGWQIWKGRMRERVGRLLSSVGVPGAVKDATIKDAVTGQEISVVVGALYVRLSVDGRDYYFDRVTGRFDGAGACVSQPCGSRWG
jgi:hypothetical protein